MYVCLNQNIKQIDILVHNMWKQADSVIKLGVVLIYGQNVTILFYLPVYFAAWLLHLFHVVIPDTPHELPIPVLAMLHSPAGGRGRWCWQLVSAEDSPAPPSPRL